LKQWHKFGKGIFLRKRRPNGDFPWESLGRTAMRLDTTEASSVLPPKVRKEPEVTLRDDLLSYMARYGQDTLALERREVVIVGELHGHLRSNDAAVRTTATMRVVRGLLTDQRFRYFGNEWFQNSGPVRHAVRDYWLRRALLPGFDNMAPGAAAMGPQEIGRRVTPRMFQPVLDDMRARPRHVLSIGSSVGGDARDRRLAQHFFEEVSDRGIAPHTPGVLLLGAAHAAATPFFMGTTTTRMILEHRGYHCTSIRIMTDFPRGSNGGPDDAVLPMASGRQLPEIRLASLTLRSPISFSTRASPDSPFFSVRDPSSDTGQSIADQYEFVVLQRG
jgi:hypothetical protein